MFLFNSIDGYFLNGWLILKTTHASNGPTQVLLKLDNIHGAFHFFPSLKNSISFLDHISLFTMLMPWVLPTNMMSCLYYEHRCQLHYASFLLWCCLKSEDRVLLLVLVNLFEMISSDLPQWTIPINLALTGPLSTEDQGF